MLPISYGRHLCIIDHKIDTEGEPATRPLWGTTLSEVRVYLGRTVDAGSIDSEVESNAPHTIPSGGTP
ncbi:hypothetical protein ACVWXU_002236 [Streptomyces sp. TE33382]